MGTETFDGARLASEVKFYMDYSKFNKDTQKRETWSEAVDRVMHMHRTKYSRVWNDELEGLLTQASLAYKKKEILGSQRALQFGGDPMLKHEARNYNCLTSYCDRVGFFQEAMYWLMCGCGVGYSVQKKHIKNLPTLKERDKEAKVFVIPDTVEGWADSIGVLISSYVSNNATFPQYSGHQVHFDFSKIRKKGSLISGGFKAPGPEGLQNSLIKIESLLNSYIGKKQHAKFSSIIAYDIVCHMANAVLSGGKNKVH